MKNTTRTLLLATVLAFVAAALAYAQLDPGWFTITVWQNGMPAGIIYVPDRAPGTNAYAEHWILYPNYVDPGAANGIVTELVPSRELSFRSEVEFFRGAPWGTGYRYVRTLSYDTAMLPGR